jgi:phage terminase large subunit
MLLHPVGYGQVILHNQYYPWQEETLNSIYRNRRTALKAANGSGKTDKIIATAVLWWMSTFPNSLCVLTSASWDQVMSQVWPAIRRHEDKLGHNWILNQSDITASNGSRCIARSTNEPGKFEGHHGTKERPLLIIADEAKTIKEPIFGAINRCTYQRLLLTSSPGIEEGYFYEAFTKKADTFNLFTATSADCPHISKEAIEADIKEYGINDPYIRSKHFAEFMRDADDIGQQYKPVKLTHYEALMRSQPEERIGSVSAYLDFAAGGDENVIAIKKGNRILPLICWRERDTMKAAAEFVVKLQELKIRPECVFGDVDGLGKPVIDRMNQLKFPISGMRNGAKPRNDRYKNAIAEAWYELGYAIERKEIILPEDAKLRTQLVNRKGKPTDAGLFGLQSKDKMRSEGFQSPDRADAVAGAWYYKQASSHSYEVKRDPFDDYLDTNSSNGEERDIQSLVPGAWAG